MTSRLRPLAFLFTVAAPALVAACASSAPPAPGAEQEREGIGAGEKGAEATEDEVRASCTYSRRWFATLDDGACAAIAGRRGAWIPEPAFTDAPPEVQASTCVFQWVGEKYSRADVTALRAAFDEADALTPACGEGSRPVVGALREIPHVDNLGHAGSVGCDVCGIVQQRRLWVILPPEKVGLRQIEVAMSNGSSRAFQIEAPAGARAVALELPPEPAGAAYLPGRVHVY